MKFSIKNIIIVFLVALLGAGLGTFGVMTIFNGTPANKKDSSIVINEISYTEKPNNDYTTAINKAYNTVVEIQATVVSNTANYYYFFGNTPSEGTASGSGVIISEDGYIVTNEHVISGAKLDSIVVTLYDGSKYNATIIGSDSRTDLAVLKIDEQGLQYSSFVDSSQLVMGEDVIAIGNPLGLGLSCSNGIISALEKEIYINNVYMTVIQTNAAVNAGNSGGGLFDIEGNLVGIVNAKKSSSGITSEASVEGMGYAIPANTVTRIVQEIIENGYVKDRAALGIKVYTGTTYNEGVMISEIIKGGSAEQAGLLQNDIITAINNISIKSYADLSKVLDSKAIGDEVTVSIIRNEQKMEFKVTLQQSISN